MKLHQALLAAASAVLLSVPALAQDKSCPACKEGPKAVTVANPVQPDGGDDAIIAAQAPSYPLKKCVVSGEPFKKGEEPVTFVVDGRMVRTCCEKCAAKVKADPTEAFAMIDKAVIEAQKASYPLKTCPISGEALEGDMGGPIDVVVGTRLVRVCCKGCIKKVKADPEKALAPVNAALIEAQRPTYKPKVCPVSGEELGGEMEPVDVLYGTHLVRLCCKGCVKKFKAHPAKYVAMLKGQMKGDHAEREHDGQGKHDRAEKHDGHGEKHDGHGEHHGRG